MNVDNIKNGILTAVGGLVLAFSTWGLITPDQATEITDASGAVVDAVATGADSATTIWAQITSAVIGLWATLSGLNFLKSAE